MTMNTTEIPVLLLTGYLGSTIVYSFSGKSEDFDCTIYYVFLYVDQMANNGSMELEKTD